MARVLIAVPTFENITPDTFQALWDMRKPEGTDFRFVRGYDCATARNKIAQLFLNGPWTHLMMVDNDVTPPADALETMLADDVDVVSGYYAHRGEDNLYSGRTCVCKLKGGDGFPFVNYPLESEYTADELRQMRIDGKHLVEIHGGGMGCVLIRAEVFMLCEYPWFDWVNYGNKKKMLSEDLFFCERLHGEGIPIYVDTRVACGHMMRHVQMPD